MLADSLLPPWEAGGAYRTDLIFVRAQTGSKSLFIPSSHSAQENHVLLFLKNRLSFCKRLVCRRLSPLRSEDCHSASCPNIRERQKQRSLVGDPSPFSPSASFPIVSLCNEPGSFSRQHVRFSRHSSPCITRLNCSPRFGAMFVGVIVASVSANLYALISFYSDSYASI